MKTYIATYEDNVTRFVRAGSLSDAFAHAKGLQHGLQEVKETSSPKDLMATVFHLIWKDVEDVAREKNLPLDLTEDEMHVFEKCVESGLSCWHEVVELALMAATSDRESEQERAEKLARQIRRDSC